MKLLVDLRCGSCGSNRIHIPASGGDESPVVCEDCGHVLATLGELKKRAEEAVLRGRKG